MRETDIFITDKSNDKNQYSDDYAERMLCLALDVGEGILRYGGEINRVEDTVERICKAYGAAHVEIFAIPSVIIAAVRMMDGGYSSQIRRIHTIENDLAKIEQFNAISYTICRQAPSLDEFEQMIREAKTKRALPVWVGFLGAAMASGSFAVFFGGSWRDGLVAFIIGAIMTLFDKIKVKQVNRFAKTALQSFFGGLLSYVSVIIGLGDNAGMIIIGTIMLLIPGLYFGTALRDLLCGDFLAGSLKTVQALLMALMIAFGYLLAMLVTGGTL